MDGQRDRRGWGGGVEERNQKEESTWAADTGKLLHARNLDYRPGPLLFLLGVRGTVPEQTAIRLVLPNIPTRIYPVTWMLCEHL